MKTCKRCGIEQDDDQFKDKSSVTNGKRYHYKIGVCRLCINAESSAYFRKQRTTEDGRQKYNAKAREMHEKHRDKILIKQKEYRSTPEYKSKRKAYIEKNKEKIRQQGIECKRKYHEKNRDEITDKYVVNLLRTQGYGKPEDLIKNKELIEIKRSEIILSRIKAEIYEQKNNKPPGATI